MRPPPRTVSREQELRALSYLVDGASIRFAERHAKIHRDTVMKIMTHAGFACDRFLEYNLVNLPREHWQIDEIWTFVYKKEKKLTPEEIEVGERGSQFLFFALGEKTKLVPYFLIGKRDAKTAKEFIKELAFRFKLGPSWLPFTEQRLSTDGFQPYPEAIIEAFTNPETGRTAKYGQMIKNPGKKKKNPDEFAVRCVISGYFDKKTICTSHIERKNLTIRHFVKRFARKTLAFSKSRRNLMAAVALHFAYYNYCWKHGTLKKTPAMAAGLAKHQWTLEELLTKARAFRY